MKREAPFTMETRIADFDRRLRKLERDNARTQNVDPRWRLQETDGGLNYIWVPSSATGPTIGRRE